MIGCLIADPTLAGASAAGSWRAGPTGSPLFAEQALAEHLVEFFKGQSNQFWNLLGFDQLRDFMNRLTLTPLPADGPAMFPDRLFVIRAEATHETTSGVHPKKRILLVDDEPAVRKLMAMNLKKQGFDVKEFEDGQSALTAFKENPEGYALAILDEGLPGMPGHQVGQELRGIRADLPILLCSGAGEGELAELLARLDLEADILSKPFTLPKLIEDARRLVEQGTPPAPSPTVTPPRPGPLAAVPAETPSGSPAESATRGKVLLRQDDLTLGVAVLGHGGPMNITGDSTLIVSTLWDLGSLEQESSLLATAKELQQLNNEYQNIIKPDTTALAQQRVHSPGAVSRSELDKLDVRYLVWLERMDDVLHAAVKSLHEAGADPEKDNPLDKSLVAAKRLRLNIQAVRVFVGGLPYYPDPIPLSGLEHGTAEGGPWQTKEKDYAIQFEFPAGLPNLLVHTPLFHVAKARVYEDCFKAIDKIQGALSERRRRLSDGQLNCVRERAEACTLPDGRPGIRFILLNPGRLTPEQLKIDPQTNRPYLFTIHYPLRVQNLSEHEVGLQFAAQAFQLMGGTIKLENQMEPGIAMVKTTIELPAAAASDEGVLGVPMASPYGPVIQLALQCLRDLARVRQLRVANEIADELAKEITRLVTIEIPVWERRFFGLVMTAYHFSAQGTISHQTFLEIYEACRREFVEAHSGQVMVGFSLIDTSPEHLIYLGRLFDWIFIQAQAGYNRGTMRRDADGNRRIVRSLNVAVAALQKHNKTKLKDKSGEPLAVPFGGDRSPSTPAPVNKQGLSKDEVQRTTGHEEAAIRNRLLALANERSWTAYELGAALQRVIPKLSTPVGTLRRYFSPVQINHLRADDVTLLENFLSQKDAGLVLQQTIDEQRAAGRDAFKTSRKKQSAILFTVPPYIVQDFLNRTGGKGTVGYLMAQLPQVLQQESSGLWLSIKRLFGRSGLAEEYGAAIVSASKDIKAVELTAKLDPALRYAIVKRESSDEPEPPPTGPAATRPKSEQDRSSQLNSHWIAGMAVVVLAAAGGWLFGPAVGHVLAATLATTGHSHFVSGIGAGVLTLISWALTILLAAVVEWLIYESYIGVRSAETAFMNWRRIMRGQRHIGLQEYVKAQDTVAEIRPDVLTPKAQFDIFRLILQGLRDEEIASLMNIPMDLLFVGYLTREREAMPTMTKWHLLYAVTIAVMKLGLSSLIMHYALGTPWELIPLKIALAAGVIAVHYVPIRFDGDFWNRHPKLTGGLIVFGKIIALYLLAVWLLSPWADSFLERLLRRLLRMSPFALTAIFPFKLLRSKGFKALWRLELSPRADPLEVPETNFEADQEAAEPDLSLEELAKLTAPYRQNPEWRPSFNTDAAEARPDPETEAEAAHMLVYRTVPPAPTAPLDNSTSPSGLSSNKYTDVLTHRQYQILELVMDGLANGWIGYLLGITEGTVKGHLSHLRGKFYMPVTKYTREELARTLLERHRRAAREAA